MKDHVTQWLNQAHAWIGLFSAWILFSVFATGTLAVFDEEITYWMLQPEIQKITTASGPVGFSPEFRTAELFMESPLNGSGGDGLVQLIKWQDKRSFTGQSIDPATGNLLVFRETRGGDLFYHFHYGLLAGLAGVWMVGAAAIAIWAAAITGVLIRRRRFIADLFMAGFRTVSLRSWSDVHNAIGLLMLPFLATITITGLVVLWSIYLAGGTPESGEAGASLAGLLHFGRFGGVVSRWGYFLMGFASSLVVATGLAIRTAKRRRGRGDRSDPLAVQVADRLAVGVVAGLLVAVAAFFWINRVLPAVVPHRADWEVRAFFSVWAICVGFGALRGESALAWRDLLAAAGVLLMLLPGLNLLTTKSHLLATVTDGQWGLAAVDITSLFVGTCLAWVAVRVRRGLVGEFGDRLSTLSVSDA
ncbi:membrane protein of unknown function [Nitrospira japonica]|uniref:Iron-regulated membrane protein n=1 Tax=Nitrospira japonica TaxID=1325564 RepID=A0A1W1IA47_9BACT|nr:PepSY-associated TM helix domain-containing protein [Nitrospira japonica]SLM49876.1 membrane protein of unknown function [Nitrospira japonica]